MNRPEWIGRYRVSQLLGSGGFASVWLGSDDTLDEPVAIKVLAENWANVPDVRSRFLQEARLLRRADSDRVVRMYDIGELPDGRPYFVMSYADGGTVAERLTGPRLSVPNALHIAVETARAVAVLHRLGVIHRDIKPSNVLVQTSPGGGERFLIGDLGVAKHLAQASGFTITAGTPGYMAPEQAELGLDIDARADVYGLGALTYHLLTGVKYDSQGVRRLAMPKKLTRVLARALEQDRNRRWPDAGAFADALAGLLPEGGFAEKRGPRAAADGSDTSKNSPGILTPRRRRGRRDGKPSHGREGGWPVAMSSSVPWPTASQYGEAVQRQDRAFSVPLLQKARFDTDGNGVPIWLEGQSAVTFLAETDEGPLAVRCFKRPPRAGLERYRALETFQRENPTSPFVAAQWHEDAIIIDGRKWPLVTMRNVSGSSLRRFVETAVEGQKSTNSILDQLAARWLALTVELSTAGVAHADLQHDNVRVTADGQLCLIDLDTVWLPAVAQSPPAELGHRHFQHPERLITGHWGRSVDAFSTLVIYLSLRALAADPELWVFHNDENLIFTENDFIRPGDTKLWHRIASSPDLEVRRVAVLLDEFCRRTVNLDTSLERILRSSSIPEGPTWAPPDRQGESDGAPWWHDPAGDDQDHAVAPVDWWHEEESVPGPATDSESAFPNGLSDPSHNTGALADRPSRNYGKTLLWVMIAVVVVASVVVLVLWGPR